LSLTPERHDYASGAYSFSVVPDPVEGAGAARRRRGELAYRALLLALATVPGCALLVVWVASRAAAHAALST
jgi:hypothetical protein